MAIDLAHLQERLVELESEVHDMQVQLREQGVLPDAKPRLEVGNSGERVLASLRAKGLISEPTPDMLKLADEWEKTPDLEKRRLREKLDSLELDPPLSQWIHENRP